MKRWQGFSTLEALCALMVLNLLGLGLLQWQWQALQAQQDAMAFQNAMGLAQDLWQRMQLNPSAASSYQMTMGDVAQGPDCHTQACLPHQWALADLTEWQQQLQLRMPGAQAQLETQLTSTASPSATVSLTLVWPSKATPSADAPSCPAQHRCWQTTWPL